jgi:hypothetical protein
MIWNTSEITLFIVAVAAFLTAIEVAFRLGRRCTSKDDALAAHVSNLQNALLGLLALLLGFTFAMSISRFDTRKALVMEEANAIGTTYLRAQFLPSPQDHHVSKLLKDYVDARIDYYQVGISPEQLRDRNVRAYNIESKLWEHAISASKSGINPIPIGQFVTSLNNMIDINEKRQVALENHVPTPVVLLLFIVATTSMGFIGYEYGLKGKRRHISTAIFALLIAVVLTFIMDIDRPRRGFVQISEESLLRLQEVIKKDKLLSAPIPDEGTAH